MIDFGSFAGQVGFVLAFLFLAYMTARLLVSNTSKVNIADSANQLEAIKLAGKMADSHDRNTEVIADLKGVITDFKSYMTHSDQRRQEQHDVVLKVSKENQAALDSILVLATDTNMRIRSLQSAPQPSQEVTLNL